MNTYIGIVIKFVCIEISYTYKHTMGEFGYAFFSRKKKYLFYKKKYLDKRLVITYENKQMRSEVGENRELDLMKFWMFLRTSLHSSRFHLSFVFIISVRTIVTYLQKCFSSDKVYGVWDLHERIQIFVQIFQHLMEALHPAILDRARFGFGVAR